MDELKSQESLTRLAARCGGMGPRVVGILTMDEDGSVAVTVEPDIEFDVLELGIRAQARRTKVLIGDTLREPVVVEEEDSDVRG